MTNNQRPSRTNRKSFTMNNRMLLILVCVLSVALFSLGLVACNMQPDDSTDPTETTVATEVTDPSTVPTETTGATEETQPTEPSETTAPTPAPTQPPDTDPPTTPPTEPSFSLGGKYVDVGYGDIAEIIQYSAETFDRLTRDDYSKPTNNYLPLGTMDYYEIIEGTGQYDFVQLRSGQRVYLKRKIYPPVEWPEVTKRYEGTLPDHNEIGVAGFQVVGNQTILTLDSLWKAPFYFDLAPQNYAYPDGGSSRDFSVSRVTATHVDITFCYATSFTGTVSVGDNPLFKSAEVIKNKNDYTLRLHLRKTGGFYGWYSYYNDNDQLCFQFLNPAKATASTGAYGADLTGIKIFIDVGHGGIDGGAEKTDASGNKWLEEELNLNLSLKLYNELKKTGATVIINRTDDTNMNTDQRIQGMLAESPDVCVAIHQNMYGSDSRVNGHWNMYFTPYSQPLSSKINASIDAAGIYQKDAQTHWNPFYMIRQSVCPVVCLENGFMTNPTDLAGMHDEATVQRKAEAIAQGIVNYFLSIS